MVTFDHIADRTSMRRVDPADLAASFGPGDSLKAVTLEVTKAAVTEERVEAVSAWISDAGKTRFTVAETPDEKLSLDKFLSSNHWREN
jgi:hypothetical protein